MQRLCALYKSLLTFIEFLLFYIKYMFFFSNTVLVHKQCIHQMKSQTILNSNLVPKVILSQNVENFGANWIILHSCLKFQRNFFETYIFQRFFLQSLILNFSTCFKHQKQNLHENLTSQTLSQTEWKALKVRCDTLIP